MHPDAGDCDVGENCDGNGNCPADAFEPSGTPCGSPTDTDCSDPDTCDGAGACQNNNLPNGSPCDDSNVCTTPDLCTGGNCIPGTSTQCLDHYKCYKAKDLKVPAKFAKQTVTLVDQFGTDSGVTVIKPAYVCNPVDKAGGGINNPVDHLTCYKIKGSKPFLDVQTTDQFGTLKLKAVKSKLLCVPGTKTITP